MFVYFFFTSTTAIRHPTYFLPYSPIPHPQILLHVQIRCATTPRLVGSSTSLEKEPTLCSRPRLFAEDL